MQHYPLLLCSAASFSRTPLGIIRLKPRSTLCVREPFAMEEIICICSIPVLYAMSFGLGRIIDTVLETRWPTDV